MTIKEAQAMIGERREKLTVYDGDAYSKEHPLVIRHTLTCATVLLRTHVEIAGATESVMVEVEDELGNRRHESLGWWRSLPLVADGA